MKRIVAIVVLLMMIVIFGCNQVYAAENIIDQQNESQLIKIKENSAKTLEEYKQIWFRCIWINSICFEHNKNIQYTIMFSWNCSKCNISICDRNKKTRHAGKRFSNDDIIRNYISNMPDFTSCICNSSKIWKGVTNESFICSK